MAAIRLHYEAVVLLKNSGTRGQVFLARVKISLIALVSLRVLRFERVSFRQRYSRIDTVRRTFQLDLKKLSFVLLVLIPRLHKTNLENYIIRYYLHDYVKMMIRDSS